MRRAKQRWDAECPAHARSAQNLTDNAKSFEEEGFGSVANNFNEVDVEPQIDDTKTTILAKTT